MLNLHILAALCCLASVVPAAAQSTRPAGVDPAPVTMAHLEKLAAPGVSIHEVSDYLFGDYAGEFTSPPQADGNPRKAFIVTWPDRPQRFVFSHEGSYCPWFELADGSGVCFQSVGPNCSISMGEWSGTRSSR